MSCALFLRSSLLGYVLLGVLISAFVLAGKSNFKILLILILHILQITLTPNQTFHYIQNFFTLQYNFTYMHSPYTLQTKHPNTEKPLPSPMETHTYIALGHFLFKPNTIYLVSRDFEAPPL